MRFDISQQYYSFVMVYIPVIAYVFVFLFDYPYIKYGCLLPLAGFIAIIIFNICKGPYLESRHIVRVYLLNGAAALAVTLIFVQNLVNIPILKDYLPAAILGL